MNSMGLSSTTTSYEIRFIESFTMLTADYDNHLTGHVILVLIAETTIEGSGEPAHPRSLTRAFIARAYSFCNSMKVQAKI